MPGDPDVEEKHHEFELRFRKFNIETLQGHVSEIRSIGSGSGLTLYLIKPNQTIPES